jgi:hypothetical protein
MLKWFATSSMMLPPKLGLGESRFNLQYLPNICRFADLPYVKAERQVSTTYRFSDEPLNTIYAVGTGIVTKILAYA